ncbi:MAG: bifunctional pyr operon transcriptional regulator/uracil phosphoribosyltransferase PyrR [Verrucomicrobiota bacterium]
MNDPSLTRTLLLSEEQISEKIRQLAADIQDKTGDKPLAIVGIHTRGVILADRVYDLLVQHRDNIQRGTLDISLYRDDLDNLGTIPSIKDSEIPFAVEGAHIILFDDVLFTGRTIRAAIDDLIDYGRPAKIELAVLVDRGNRELPICPDYTGEKIETSKDDYISVFFGEKDGEEGVYRIEGQDDP